jgi:hypothetical protein
MLFALLCGFHKESGAHGYTKRHPQKVGAGIARSPAPTLYAGFKEKLSRLNKLGRTFSSREGSSRIAGQGPAQM